jgi:hypothetical protein
MKSLRQFINEDFFDNIGISERGLIEDWLKENNVTGYEIVDDLTVWLKYKPITITSPIPEYVKLKGARVVNIEPNEDYGNDILKNLPDLPEVMYINNITITNFEPISDLKIVSRLIINNCDIKSLKGLPECPSLYIGNNKQYFSKKEIKKYAKIKHICNFGEYENKYGLLDVIVGVNDKPIVDKFNNDIQKLLKEVPEIKSIDVSSKQGVSNIYIRLDYLNKNEMPYGYESNSIYLTFKYDMSEGSLELYDRGHLNLTKKDKEGKYKYFALKSFTDPYLDKGGKKFRKTKLDEFTYDEFLKKTKKFIIDVTAAAVEDQGGELKRH